MHCLLCSAEVPTTKKGRPAKFCGARHRVQYHRIRQRSLGGVVSMHEALRSWRREHQPPPDKAACMGALAELVDIWQDVQPMGGAGGALRRLADRCDELLSLLNDSEALMWALNNEYFNIEHPLDDLQRSRGTLEQLAELGPMLADELDEVGRMLPRLRRTATEIEEVLAIEAEDSDAGEG